MRSGEPFRCTACGADSIAKTRRKMDGFRCVGEELVCMLCGAVLPAGPETAPSDADAGRTGALADLLGVAGDGPERLDDDGVRHFCRDCRHYISHPFLSRCDRHGRAADPMGDCPDFAPRRSDPPETPEQENRIP